MGLADAISTALIKIKADTGQAKAELKSLRGVERQAAQERLTELNAQNAKIDSHIALLGKATAVVGGLAVAYVGAKAAASAYLEDVRLKAAATGVNVDRLREATRGLVEEDKLLAFAGKAQAGVWKLNQREMETVLRGADALRKTMGLELGPTIDQLTESITKGATRGLKEFGIEAKDKESALRQLDALFAGLHGNTKLAGDEMQAAGVKMHDTFDDLQGKLGEFVIQMTPAIEALAGMVGWLSKGIERLDDFTDRLLDIDSRGTATQQRVRQARGLRTAAALIRKQGYAPGSSEWGSSAQRILFPDAVASDLERQADQLERYATMTKGAGRDALMAATQFGRAAREMLGGLAGAFGIAGDRPGGGGGGGKGAGGRGGPTVTPGYGKNVPGGSGSAAEDLLGADAGSAIDFAAARNPLGGIIDKEISLRDRRHNAINAILGTPEEIDATTKAIELLGSGVSGLTEVLTGAFDAWIVGNESIIGSFKKLGVEMMRSIANYMFAESLKYAAIGTGMLVFPDPRSKLSAGQAFKAAGLFAAGSLVVGGMAKAGGHSTGQWGEGGGGGGGAPNLVGGARDHRGGLGSGSGGENRTVIVYVGAEWGALSAREQAGAIVRAMDLGKADSPHIRRRW